MGSNGFCVIHETREESKQRGYGVCPWCLTEKLLEVGFTSARRNKRFCHDNTGWDFGGDVLYLPNPSSWSHISHFFSRRYYQNPITHEDCRMEAKKKSSKKSSSRYGKVKSRLMSLLQRPSKEQNVRTRSSKEEPQSMVEEYDLDGCGSASSVSVSARFFQFDLGTDLGMGLDLEDDFGRKCGGTRSFDLRGTSSMAANNNGHSQKSRFSTYLHDERDHHHLLSLGFM